MISKNISKDNIFDKDKNTAIKDTSSLGLGIYLTKQICEKNSILYFYENTAHIFSLKYIF